jgi:glycosyltransferase involved in cell wall biosynthesis
VDDTAILVQHMADVDSRIKFLQQPNSGVASARNLGIAHAAGEFIAPLDADDLWHPEKIAKQVALIHKASERVGLVYCWTRSIDAQDRIICDVRPCSFRGNVHASLIARNFVSSCAPLVKKKCAEEIGGYDVTLSHRGATGCEDLKFYLNIAERFEFDLVPEFLAAYRVSAESMSADLETMRRSHRMVIEEVRQRHPELPAGLFRMANGHRDREFGLSYISKGNLANGAQLLLNAFLKDPFSTIQMGAARLLARIWRGYRGDEYVTAMAHRIAANRVLKRYFFEVEPTVFCER